MNYPTSEELKVAYDAITADGEQAEPTITLCAIMTIDPLMRDTVRLTTRHALKVFTEGPTTTTAAILQEAFIMSCIVKGLNIGLRVSDARLGGIKSRATIENMIEHVKDCTETKPECADQIIQFLDWVLGERTGAPMKKEDGMILDVEAAPTGDGKIRLKYVAISGGHGPEILLDPELTRQTIRKLESALLKGWQMHKICQPNKAIDDTLNSSAAWEERGGTAVRGMTYEQGVGYGIRWMLGLEKEMPIQEEPQE